MVILVGQTWYKVTDLGNGKARVESGNIKKQEEDGQFPDKSSAKIITSNSSSGPGESYPSDQYSWELIQKKPNI